jgi:hypothetical protein
MGVERVESA